MNIKNQIKNDFEHFLPDIIRRVEEVKKIKPNYDQLIFSAESERLMDEANSCYIYGFFTAYIIMWCNAFDALLKSLLNTTSFDSSIKKAKELNIISLDEFNDLKRINERRNKIVHIKTHVKDDGKLFLENMKKNQELIFSDYSKIYKKSSQIMRKTKIFYRIQGCTDLMRFKLMDV